jgi:hypothetical protein
VGCYWNPTYPTPWKDSGRRVLPVMDSATGQRPDLCARVVATNGISAFDPFLDHQQPPLLVYITNEGVTVPSDGIYEALAGSG